MALVNKTFSDIITFTRASTATFFNSAGVLQSAAIDVPRFDYNPSTLAAQGLLIEEARTNSIYPSNFSSIGTGATNNAWYETFATLDTTVNAAVAPDGTTTAALLAINAATSFNAVFYRTASTTAGTYAYSVFCKANSTDTLCRILLSGEAGVTNTVRADFTLSGAGTASAASVSGTGVSAASPTIQSVGNGWYRCAIYATLTAPTNITALVYPGNVGAQTTASQTLVWGAQLEAGAFPTSYIPTTTAALTRAADVASVNTLSPWFNSVAGTLFAEVQRPSTANNNGATAGLNDGTANNRFQLRYDGSATSTNFIVLTSSVNFSQSLSFVSGGTNKAALAYETNNVNSAANGVAGTTDTSEILPTGLTTLGIGSVAGAGALNGYLRRITYYPRRLSNAELQAITA